MRQRRPQNWTVEVSPRAWEQLGVVPGDVFRQIKRELDAVAQLVEDEQPTPGSRLVHSRSLTVEQYAALYRLDFDQQVVILEEVTRRLDSETSDQLTQTGRRRRL